MRPVRVLLDFANPHDAQAPRLRGAFSEPLQVLQAREPGEVGPVLQAAEEAALQGRWCVGFLRYEAAAAFDAALQTHAADGPLAWFAVFERCQPWPAVDEGEALPAQIDWQPGIDRGRFEQVVGGLQRQIAERLGYRLVDHRLELFGVKLDRTGAPAAIKGAMSRRGGPQA